MEKINLSFKPKQVTKRLVAVLAPRAREVLEGRYGLTPDASRITLEGIGKTYGITRERVRQIENYAIASIRKSSAFQAEKPVFDELVKIFDSLGGIVAEEEFLEMIAKDQSTKNHVHFLLVIGEPFTKMKEDEEFEHRWFIDQKVADKIHDSLRTLYKNISDNDLIPEAELIKRFLQEVEDLNENYRDEEIARRWLGISKGLGKNPLGEWGRTSSPNVRVKGMRDYAYLVIKRHGSPMHFREVAKAITTVFNKKAHEATTHNELIKDKRFVLVGRGLYALAEWGYTNGVVKDVIASVLKKSGPLSREDIIEKVRNERYVKNNTIIVNLQDSKLFKRDKNGLYSLARG
jgi:hypothetical protein